MKHIIVPLSISLAFFLFNSSLCADEEWKKIFDRDGIAIFSRPVAGSDFDEFKSIGYIEAPLETVNRILGDVPGMVKWMPDSVACELIEKKGDDEVIFHYEIKLGWFLSNRDAIVAMKVKKDGNRITREIHSISDTNVPPKKDRIRVTELNGKWILEDHGNRTLAIYQLRVNPAGKIPAFLANLAVRDAPYETFTNLRIAVKKLESGDRKLNIKNTTAREQRVWKKNIH